MHQRVSPLAALAMCAACAHAPIREAATPPTELTKIVTMLQPSELSCQTVPDSAAARLDAPPGQPPYALCLGRDSSAGIIVIRDARRRALFMNWSRPTTTATADSDVASLRTKLDQQLGQGASCGDAPDRAWRLPEGWLELSVREKSDDTPFVQVVSDQEMPVWLRRCTEN